MLIQNSIEPIVAFIAPGISSITKLSMSSITAIDIVSAANLKLLADKSYQELLISGTFELEPATSPAEYKQYVESELTRWRPIVTAMGIKID